MPRALPLLVVAVLTPAGIWHVGAPGPSTTAYADPAVWVAVVDTGQASERRIVGRGPVSRGTMPVSAPPEGSATAPEERRRPPVLVAANGPRAPPLGERLPGAAITRSA
jgi:hypothetical protein